MDPIRVTRILKALGVFVGAVGIAAFLLVSMLLLTFAPEATPEPSSESVRVVKPGPKPCAKWSANRFNKLLAARKKLTGKNFKKRRRPVCVRPIVRRIQAQVNRAKRNCNGGNPKKNRCLGKRLAAKHGWTGAQWQCLDTLWRVRESGWSHTAINKSSGAAGIPQRLPMPSRPIPASFYKSPHEQIQWGLNYIAGRYGTPCGALAHSHANGWY